MIHFDVSIIVVSWNTREILRNCIESVYRHTRDIGFEVIVVDNGSADDSVKMMQECFPGAAVIQNNRNLGFAAANNQGMGKSLGRYVLLLNSDTVLLDNAMAKMVAFADSHSEAAVVGCRVLNPDKTLQRTCFMFPSILNMFLSSTYLYKLFPRSKFFGREQMTWWERDNIREVDVVTGCCMLVRRAAIEQVGMMDEQFFMYAEETDWCYRFKKAGWKVFFAPVAEIIHFGGQSSKQTPTKMLVQLRLSILRFIKKHYGWLSHKIASLLVVLFFAIRVPVWLIVCGFGNNRRKTANIKLRAYLSGIKQIFFPSCNSLAEQETI